MFAKVIRMSHANASINNGDGNAPKMFPDGSLYGSSQSTKRQIMEASGIVKTTRDMGKILEEYEFEKVGAKNSKTKESSKDKHTILWDDEIKSKLDNFNKDDYENTEKASEAFRKIILDHENTPARVFGHFNAFDGATNKIDGAYGTTGHRGIGRYKVVEDKFTTITMDDDTFSTHMGEKKIAADEYYWSVHTFNYDLYPEVSDSLDKIADACMTKVLHPRANKNCSELSVEWAIKVINDENTNINLPKIRSENLNDILPVIQKRNPNCRIEVFNPDK